MGPGWFSTQCVDFSKTKKECVHIPKVWLIEAPTKLSLKLYWKLFDQSLSINGSCFSPLFFLNTIYHLGIDGLKSTASRLNEDFPDLPVDALDSLILSLFPMPPPWRQHNWFHALLNTSFSVGFVPAAFYGHYPPIWSTLSRIWHRTVETCSACQHRPKIYSGP